MRKRAIIICIGIILILGTGVAAAYMIRNHSSVSQDASSGGASLIDKSTLNALQHASTSNIKTAHLADGLVPPTNKWYSGMVLTSEPKPGFAVPNSILASNDGFELGLPGITSTSEGVYGPHVNGIAFRAAKASSYKLTRYDELTITLTYYDDSRKPVFEVTFASGSPYAFVLARQDTAVTLQSGAQQDKSNGLTTFKNNDAWYGAKTSNGQTGPSLNLKNGDRLALFSTPAQAGIDDLASAADYPIVSGEVHYKKVDSRIETTLSYVTKDNKPSVLVRMPHQVESNDRPLAKYPSIYGSLAAYKANTIHYRQPVQPLEWSLPLATISTDDKTHLVGQLKQDIANTKLDKDDTYFGGKQLQRLAQLVMVADSLSESKLRSDALAKLEPALATWFDDNSERSFYYDQTAKAIVGNKASFGSDTELNDHHFHYGYSIYAASVTARFDKDFLKKYKADVDLLVADIANYNTRKALPLRRNFDPYASHSWASGLANYGDGNNQESSGEAVNAWTGIGLWADLTNNEALKNEAAWLLSGEIAAAKLYYFSRPNEDNYTSPLVSINWGGKREYKTFFSDEANAKLAIQLLPLNPTMKRYVGNLPASIYEGSNTSKQYGDYILMAQGGVKALEVSQDYPESLIDDGNSKTYMMAYAIAD